MVNWSRPTRRRILLTAAVIFYLGRTTSALYFAPHALEWGQHPTTLNQLHPTFRPLVRPTRGATAPA